MIRGRNLDNDADILTAITETVIDLSGAALTRYLLHPRNAITVKRITLIYTEGSSSDAGIALEVGVESDRNGLLAVTTEVSKAQWYEKEYKDEAISGDYGVNILAGDTIRVYSPGSKAGVGEILVKLEYNIK